LINDRERAQAQKRGGGRAVFSLDSARAEEGFRVEPADDATPETIYEQRWAETVLEARICQMMFKETRFANLARHGPPAPGVLNFKN